MPFRPAGKVAMRLKRVQDRQVERRVEIESERESVCVRERERECGREGEREREVDGIHLVFKPQWRAASR